MKSLIIFLFVFVAVACSKDNSQGGDAPTLTTDFENGAGGWVAGFADYPVGDDGRFELESGIRNLPQPLDQTRKGFFLSGRNLSDDLFMYLKKKVTGLLPHTSYTVQFNLSLASNAPSNAVGIGGAPGESVFLGVGVMATEPVPISADGYVRMNIDKGNQATGGADRTVIGHIANGTDTAKYVLIERQGTVSFKTNAAGEAWLMVSTDSGFEGKTSLYYDSIRVTFTRQ